MIELSIEHMERLEAALQETPEKIPRAAARAINRAAHTARTEAARKARQEYVIRHGDVIKTVKVYPASEADLSASVISKGSVIPLIKFKVNPKTPQPKRRKPLTATVRKGEGGPIARAFTAQMKSGYIGVFQRAGKPRYPINQLYGPSIPQMIGSRSVSQWVEERAREKLSERLEHEINRALED
ncbi:MAG: phage tail protein [Gorillibacterium sp.]|nr:phage tail protein [Gorillibacterium sp.]